MVRLAILYEPNKGRPLLLASLADRQLLAAAARAALAEAELRCDILAEADEGLALVQREEVDRLRRVLSMFVPEAKIRQKRMAAQGLFDETSDDDHAPELATVA
jgi:hypothetical protein